MSTFDSDELEQALQRYLSTAPTSNQFDEDSLDTAIHPDEYQEPIRRIAQRLHEMQSSEWDDSSLRREMRALLQIAQEAGQVDAEFRRSEAFDLCATARNATSGAKNTVAEETYREINYLLMAETDEQLPFTMTETAREKSDQEYAKDLVDYWEKDKQTFLQMFHLVGEGFEGMCRSISHAMPDPDEGEPTIIDFVASHILIGNQSGMEILDSGSRFRIQLQDAILCELLRRGYLSERQVDLLREYTHIDVDAVKQG